MGPGPHLDSPPRRRCKNEGLDGISRASSLEQWLRFEVESLGWESKALMRGLGPLGQIERPDYESKTHEGSQALPSNRRPRCEV